MKIQELADATGLSIHTIRYYEKEGLLDARHVTRTGNNYRSYTPQVFERLNLIRKFQRIGCSLSELRQILQDHDTQAPSNQEIIAWIDAKIADIERRKQEYDQILATLKAMREYRQLLSTDPERARAIMAIWQSELHKPRAEF